MIRKLLCTAVTVACVVLAGCGGGSNDTAASTPGPMLSDNVLMSSGPAANGVVVTISHAGYLRAIGTGTDRALTIGVGSAPMSGTANSATGTGWQSASGTFIQANTALNLNSDGKGYSLKVKSSSGSASDSTLALNSILVSPNVSSLAGTYGLASSTQIVIAGNSFTGTYGFNCTWSGNLTPQTRTVDVTNIQFQTAVSDLNPAGIACPYAGKTFTGTAFLMGPSAAYPKGVFVINWDDGGSGMPTAIEEGYFIRQ